MDNGSEENLIRADLLMEKTRAALKILDRRSDCFNIVNNGVVIGTVKEKVLIQFKLETLPGVSDITYTEWFHLWEKLEDEMVIGGEFMERQGFTTMHKTLLRLKKHEHPQRADAEKNDGKW